MSPFPHTLSFAILCPSTSIMCFKTIPVVSRPRSNITRRRQSNPANLHHISTSSTTPLSFSMALWNCQSAVNKADFISAFSLQSTLRILGLTETWIRPEDSATPAALSNNFSFSHTPRQVGRGGGTGLLISNNWKYSTHSPLCNYNSFESHAITVMAPIKLQIVVIYRPPGQILAPFLEELDGLLSSFMEDGTPLLVFGDFNIHLEKPYATDFHSLLASFDLKRLTTTSTHKSGNQLDLIYTRDCTADNILVQPLHISDHFFIKFTLHFATRVPPTPLPVTFRQNLRSLSPSHLSSVVSSFLPSPTHFSSLDVNAATDTLCSTLTTCLDDICPLSSRPARTAPSNPWLSDVFREHRTRLRAAERKWRKSNEPSDLSMYQSFLSSFSTEVHTAKSSHFHNKINNAPDMRNLFKTFNSLLCPPSPPPTTSITADDFATFFTNKTKTISSQFSPPLTQDPQPTRSTAQTPIFSFCPLTEAEVSKLLLSSHPTTCPLDPIPSHLLQAISPTLLPALTHIINTSLLTGIFPTAFKQARVTPLLKKPTLNTSLLENYRPVSLLPFIPFNLAKTELLVFPATPTLHHDFTIQLGSSTITPSASVRNLGVIFDGQLTFKEHITKTARSCRFALHNIRKIRPFLTEHAAQLLVQALVISRLDYFNALLAGLPSNTIKPLQMIQNAAARLVFNEPKRAHVTPLFVSLHWLPVAARIQFKTLMLAYRTTTGSAPT